MTAPKHLKRESFLGLPEGAGGSSRSMAFRIALALLLVRSLRLAQELPKTLSLRSTGEPGGWESTGDSILAPLHGMQKEWEGPKRQN